MSDRNNPQIIRNCKKDINLAFISNQIEESFVSLQISYEKMGKLGDKYKTKSTRPIQDVLIWFTVAEVLDV